MQHSWFHLWIFISGGQVAVDSADFDFTLLYKLIRNLVTGIPAPTRGWGNPPCCSNEADNIERIRYLRNNLAHNSKLEISEADFSTYWTDLSEVKIIYNYHTIPICRFIAGKIFYNYHSMHICRFITGKIIYNCHSIPICRFITGKIFYNYHSIHTCRFITGKII